MTDRAVIEWVGEVLEVGRVNEKKVTNQGIKGVRKRQWRWRCGYRDALYVAKILWPYAQVKLHNEPRAQELGDNVVDLATEREIRKIWP